MSNQTQFEITQKIHQELDKLAKTTGIKVNLNYNIKTYSTNNEYKLGFSSIYEYKNIPKTLIEYALPEYSNHAQKLKKQWCIREGLEPETINLLNLYWEEYEHFAVIYSENIINTDQIKQILIAFEEKLGENPEWQPMWDINDEENMEARHAKNSQSAELCQKWLDGLNPLFDQNPTQVLTELLEILQTIK